MPNTNHASVTQPKHEADLPYSALKTFIDGLLLGESPAASRSGNNLQLSLPPGTFAFEALSMDPAVHGGTYMPIQMPPASFKGFSPDVKVEGKPIFVSAIPVSSVKPSNDTVYPRPIAYLKIQDGDGNCVDLKPEQLKISAEGPESVQGKVVETPHGPGWLYGIQMEPNMPGEYKVGAYLGDKDILQDPIKAIAYSVDPDHCEAKVGLKPVQAGEPTTFTILAKDKNGDRVRVGGAPFDVSVTAPSGDIKPVIKDNNDGSYDVTYVPTSKGDHNIPISVFGRPISNSPLKSVVEPGKVKLPNEFVADGSPSPNEFHVLAAGPEKVEGSVYLKPSGVYGVQFNPTKLGDYDVDVTRNGKPVFDPKEALKAKVALGTTIC